VSRCQAGHWKEFKEDDECHTCVVAELAALRLQLADAGGHCTIRHTHVGACVGCFTEEHNLLYFERDKAREERDDLRQQNARLVEALIAIANAATNPCEHSTEEYPICTACCMDVAFAALAGTKKRAARADDEK
jgi:hypothetical protein